MKTKNSRLRILRPSVRKNYVICRCICGTNFQVYMYNVLSGHTKSCGCLTKQLISKKIRTHGESQTRTYRAWINMHWRTKTKGYLRRKIKVCFRWMNYQAFKGDMGKCPKGMTLDRIDNQRGYMPGNCRWTTQKVQANNTSRNHIIRFKGHKFTISQWAEKLGLKANTLLYRIKRGWSLDRALK